MPSLGELASYITQIVTIHTFVLYLAWSITGILSKTKDAKFLTSIVLLLLLSILSYVAFYFEPSGQTYLILIALVLPLLAMIVSSLEFGILDTPMLIYLGFLLRIYEFLEKQVSFVVKPFKVVLVVILLLSLFLLIPKPYRMATYSHSQENQPTTSCSCFGYELSTDYCLVWVLESSTVENNRCRE